MSPPKVIIRRMHYRALLNKYKNGWSGFLFFFSFLLFLLLLIVSGYHVLSIGIFIHLTTDEFFPGTAALINTTFLASFLIFYHLLLLLHTPLEFRVEVTVKGLEPEAKEY